MDFKAVRVKKIITTSSTECQSQPCCVFSCHYQVTTGKYSVLGRTLNSAFESQLSSLSAPSTPQTNIKHTGCRYLSTAFKKASISCSFPHHPACGDKAGSRKQRGLVGVCSSSLSILGGRRREITINDTS